ncbi:MAG: sulfite exporter TauE/SafE family protein [Planctomycetota bacterium]
MTALIVFSGYVAAFSMGGVLGLIGAGGSILTVPILVYLFEVSPSLATVYSLFIVGLTALTGTFQYLRRDLIDVRAAALFGLPSLAGVILCRRLIVPAVPDPIWAGESFTMSKEQFVLVAFSAFMLLAAVAMVRSGRRAAPDESASRPSALFVLLDGLVVGAVTGFVGAGGGFLIVPALVLLVRLPVKVAVGTSLLVIAIKSLAGFGSDALAGVEVDWGFLAAFSAISIAGGVVGERLNGRVSSARLKPAFGWFVLAMGTLVLTKELIL